MKLMLEIGGIYNLICALLHFGFPKMMDWQKRLAFIPEAQRPFVTQPLYIMNWCMAVLWIILALLPLFHAEQMLEPGIGRALLFCIVIFWIIRICILQPVYMGFKEPVSKKMTGFFLVGLVLFCVPLMVSLF